MDESSSRARLILRQPGFAGLLASTFALGIGFSFVSPYLSLWGTKAVGMRPSTFGLFMTATSLSAIVVATTLARWSDTHLPRKVMLVLGALGGMGGYASYALIRDPRILICLGCTVLAVGAVSFSQLFAYTRERYFGAEIPGVPRGFLMSVVRVCFSLAWTAGPSIGAWVMVNYDFRGLFLCAAGLFFFYLLGVLRFVPYEPRPPHVRAAVHEPVWRILTRGDILAAFLAFLCIYAAHTMNAMNLPLMLTDVLGGNGRDVGIAFGVGPVAEIPLMLWFGHLAAHGHSLRLLRFGGAATLVYFVLLSQVQAPWHVFVAQILHGTSFAIISNVGILFFQNLVPGQPGLATTVFANAANVGNLVGFLGFGLLVQPLGNRRVFLASAALTAVTTAVMLAYRPRRT